MPILVYTLHPGAIGVPSGRGAVMSLSDAAANALRERMGGSTGDLDASSVPLLDELRRTSVVDRDLRLLVSSIEQHGTISVRLI